MRVLITGDKGFVGRHLARACEARGWDVLGVDLVDGFDALDFFRRNTTRFDIAFHCAAIVGGRASIDGTPLGVATNLALDSWFMRWLQRTGTPRAVYFSSSAAYPVELQRQGIEHMLTEDDIDLDSPELPDSTYGWAKLTGEQLARRVEGCRILIPRPFSGYGSDQALEYPFPAIVKRAMTHVDGEPFTVWGHPGSARSWVHIDDVIGCVLAAIDADDIGPMNICTGVATTFEQLATMALAAVGCSAPIVGDTSKPTGVFWRVGDPERMQQVYTPKVTLAEGIRRAVEELSQCSRD